MSALIYLDNNATTSLLPEVRAAMEPFLAESYANPSSLHRFGADAGRALGGARETISEFIGARWETEIVFTSSGTESNVTAIRGILTRYPSKRHVVSTQVEHPSVLLLLHELEHEGYRVTYVPVDSCGALDVGALENSLSADTALVSVMWANNETGVLFPIETIGAMARARKIPFHVDAVQSAPRIPISVDASPIDLLSLSGHKLHGPKGIGALYVRRGLELKPLFFGHQERGLRGGTENVAGAVGFAKACELAPGSFEVEATRVRALRDRLERALLARVPGVSVVGAGQERLTNTLSVTIDGIEGETLVLMASERDVALSTGSACTAGSVEPSHVLLAMGIPYDRALGALRFSLSALNTDREIDCVIELLPKLVSILRAVKRQREGVHA